MGQEDNTSGTNCDECNLEIYSSEFSFETWIYSLISALTDNCLHNLNEPWVEGKFTVSNNETRKHFDTLEWENMNEVQREKKNMLSTREKKHAELERKYIYKRKIFYDLIVEWKQRFYAKHTEIEDIGIERGAVQIKQTSQSKAETNLLGTER